MFTMLQVLIAGVLAVAGWAGGWGGWHGELTGDAGGAAGGACLVGAEECWDDPGNGTGLGMCAPGHPDCVDVVVDPGGEVDCGADGCAADDEFDEESEREQARALLGVAETDLSPDVRIARRGDELFALTEDYRLGRDTVELDADADGVYRVVLVTVELVDGPETFTAE